MTRHPIRHVFMTAAGAVLAVSTASAEPPSKPVTRQTTTDSGQTVHVQVPPGTRYVVPRTDPNTTYVVEIEQDTRALAATRAERDAALARVRELEKIEADQRELVISLGGTVMFRHDDATLLPAARARLDQVADALKRTPDRQIVIEGHADAMGTAEYNRGLSEKRAQAVRSYLLQRGVAPDRIVAKGRGEKDPIAPNRTAEGRANNRRAEIAISPSKTPSAG